MTAHSSGTGTSVEAKKVSRVAILGGGPAAAGIAAVSAVRTEAAVTVKESDDDGVRRALARVSNEVSRQITRGEMTASEAERVAGRVTATTEWIGLQNADLVIESAFESLDLKRSLLAEAEAATGDNTVFASNTSILPIARIAAHAAHPEAVLGMHYFSPPELKPLLEIVVTEQTTDLATATAVEFGKQQGKMVIVVKDEPGFYTTRLLVPYLNEAFYLLSEGASIEAIDGAMERWGFPAGPFLLADEVGIDFVANATKVMVDAFGERISGPDLMSSLI
jgi:3-hydroxyacyl-CoA dehydrogenase/enoyl-CoA hydratase/3-hydroxybutyryl-CoA epimerase